MLNRALVMLCVLLLLLLFALLIAVLILELEVLKEHVPQILNLVDCLQTLLRFLKNFRLRLALLF